MSNDWIDAEGFRANVGIILVNAENKLLLGGRVGAKGWQFPQGGIDEGEAPEEAMYRELREEVGLEPGDVVLFVADTPGVVNNALSTLRLHMARRFELIDESHGVITHHACPALDRFEHFDDVRLKHCCDICIAGMPISGEMLNQKIECKPLKLPPRRHAKDIACQWEYKLRDQS